MIVAEDHRGDGGGGGGGDGDNNIMTCKIIYRRNDIIQMSFVFCSAVH